MSKTAITIGMTLILLAAPIVGAVGAATPTATTSSSTSAQEYETGIENVSIWERSMLPFRADRDQAETSIDLHDTYINPPNNPETRVNRDQVGVFNTGTDVPLELEEKSLAETSKYNDTPVRVIVAEPDSNVAAGAGVFGDVAMFENGASSLNENVTFENISKTTITDDGTLADDVPYEPDSSGQHVAMVTTIESGDGLTVDDGNLTATGEATIVGLETFFVQDESSTAELTDDDLDSGDLGDNVTFQVNTTIDTGADGTVGHGVVLYDEDAFRNTRTTINITASPGENLSADDITIEPGVRELNGVMHLENETISDIILANESESEGIVLNGSETAVLADSKNTTIDVETLEKWDADATYRYVHVAMDETGDNLQTTTGTTTFTEEDKGGGSPPPGMGLPPSPSPPEDDETDKGDKSTPVITFDPGTATVGEPVTISGANSTDANWDIISYEWTIDGQAYTGETVTTTFDEPGQYTVELTVKNQIGETATTTKPLTVKKKTGSGTEPGTGADTDGTGDDGDTDGTDGDDGDGGGVLPIPGFGVPVSIVALLSAALLLVRRQD